MTIHIYLLHPEMWTLLIALEILNSLPLYQRKPTQSPRVISRAAPSWAPSADCPPSLGQRPNLAFMTAVVGETPAAGRNQVDFEKEETEARGWLGHSLSGQVLSNSINSS